MIGHARLTAPGFGAVVALTLALLPGCAGDGGGDDNPGTPTPDTSPTPAQCQPEAGGPYWLLEGESVELAVVCGSGLEMSGEAFGIAPIPEGANWDPATGTLTWTPKLDQAAVYELTITVTPGGESGTVKIGVADAWENPANVPVVDPTKYPEEYGLPVFFLAPGPTDFDEYHPCTVVHGGHTYDAEGKKRGRTSKKYPKNNYTLKFTREDKFQEPSRGFVNKRKVVLYGGFDDNSNLRARLSFEAWKAIDPEHIQVQTYHAVVYVDGEYWGLYTAIDHIDGFLMEDHGYDQDGDLYKAVSHTADFRLANGHVGFEKKEGFPEEGTSGAWKTLDELVNFADASSDSIFREQAASRLDVRDYQDWWILVTLIQARDSAGKNSYHYVSAGPFRTIPWDFNASYGQSWETKRLRAEDDSTFAHRNRIFERFLADPVFYDPMYERYGDVLADRCTAEDVLGWIDEDAALIEASALRNERKWDEAYRTYDGWNDRTDFTTWREEVEYVRDWVAKRWLHQQSKFPP